MAASSEIFLNPDPHGHFVQLYGEDATMLANNVSAYLAEGLKRGEGALVIATPEHCAAFLKRLEDLGVDTALAIANSTLLVLDAQRTLGGFMMDGEPDWARFEPIISSALAKVGTKRLRAYGEMVGILWAAREYTAAIRVEEYWNRLIGAGGFSLFCSYPIDIFDAAFHPSGVEALLCDHTHLIPTGSDEGLESALYEAIDQHLGSKAGALRQRIKAEARPGWGVLPKAESIILWLRNHAPLEAEGVLSSARRNYDLLTRAA